MNSLNNLDIPVQISSDAIKFSNKPKVPTKLPYWYIYVAWSLVCLACVVSSFFVILYGLQFGMVVSCQWLTSMSVSFLQDVLITEPLKVSQSWTLFFFWNWNLIFINLDLGPSICLCDLSCTMLFDSVGVEEEKQKGRGRGRIESLVDLPMKLPGSHSLWTVRFCFFKKQ